MRSALYYPHTRIQNEELLKTALLLWDQLELIVPDPGYKGIYHDKRIAKAVEMIGVAHFPTEAEKKQAHERIKDFCDERTGPLPEAFFYQSRKPFDPDFGIYPEKLLDETWTLLKEAKLARRSESYPANISFTTPAGLSIMTILADCCAGKTRSRVTDIGVAYATLTGLLGSRRAAKLSDASSPSDEHLVPITLEVINLGSVGLDKLIDFRERENAGSGHAIRDLRHRYVDRIESYVKKLAATKGSASDQVEIKREFTSDMKDDLAALRDELRFARNDALFSKEMLVSILAAVGSVAVAAFGVPFAVPEVVTAGGGVVTVGGLLGVRNKYLASRRSVLEKHPMAYLYEMQSSKVAAM